jgi:hypothetical protein
MEENKRLYPISREVFNQKILPVIEASYIWKGRPPKVSHYIVKCEILTMFLHLFIFIYTITTYIG